ncbi:BTB/POZ domain protein [Ancylostoma duodenale]|uniref:BTB/POZ domain protein n=1 Tax=Ancylostoma duodenale TaxID=51022 RepID=A0A0C2GKZ9_9BILA|nr:BTB/POZ domain protein [Ancylostoma duodenale]
MDAGGDIVMDAKTSQTSAGSSTMTVPMYHKSTTHSRLLLSQLAELRDDSRLCDVALVVKGTRINAHRLVLTACSNYFKAMFTGEMAESRLQEIEMVDMDAYTLDALVNFCYSGEIKITDVNVQSILPAACLLQLNEVQVFAAVVQWVRFDLPSRKQYLSKLLEHVRLPLCHPKFLVSTVSEDALVKADAACRDLVDEAKNYLLLPLERPNMQGPRTRPRKPIKFGEVLYAVGGWCSGDAIASVERLDPGKAIPVWQCVAPMSKRRCGVGVAVVDNLLYAVGGHDGQTYLNSIERFDPATNQWSCDVAPTSTCRTSVGVAVLDGFLYAVGGQDGINCLDVVERYDARRNEWTCVAPMGTRRLGVSVSVLNGCLYAVGGSDGQSPLNTVERLDPRVGKWDVVRPMSTRRKHLGSAVFDGHLYAVGGRDDSCELSSAEKYNPVTNEWTAVVAMNNRRSGVGLAVVNERMYAVGGFDGTTYLKTAEVFDPEANQWRHHGCMNYRRLGGGVGVIRMPYQPQQPSYDTGAGSSFSRPHFPSDLC